MRVYVAVYEHNHGEDISVYATKEGANKWRAQLADEWWSHEFPYDMPPNDPGLKADVYWDKMAENGEEFFNIHECDVVE